ncbi:unnamed protein product [Mycetohabitans rhizoxinica HKI 454]|uniref:Uncharacterized protein n=1 Tax=Mycetohabitans rhizoxinica (strain DSM 19002 / CIP 109453 / HKI 454) TaxID=882378 RepID=E5AQV8_MYCRK|nr:unnamed protein product [Mycetohabitans rhizoxinica HKI 454]
MLADGAFVAVGALATVAGRTPDSALQDVLHSWSRAGLRLAISRRLPMRPQLNVFRCWGTGGVAHRHGRCHGHNAGGHHVDCLMVVSAPRVRRVV